MTERVLEIGGHAAGFCGRLFVQSGADVVRVETAPVPSYVSDAAMELYLHAGKRRVRTANQALIADLAAKADVVVAEAGTSAALDDLGIDDWAAPVKAAITPFGRTGPKRDWQATSNTLLAMGGYTYIMGDPGRAPLTLPGHYLEFQSGALAYTAANAARLAGEPSSIDIAMLDTLMALSQFTTVLWHCAGEIRSRHGSDYWSVVPTTQFRCVDGWVYVNIPPLFWEAFAAFLEQPELLADERFTTNPLRMENREPLHEIVAAKLSSMTKAEIESRAEECRIPAGVVKTMEEVLADPHLAERDFWQEVEGPLCTVRSPRPAWFFHGESGPAQKLHTPEVIDG